MQEFLYRFEDRPPGLVETITLASAEAVVGNVVEVVIGGTPVQCEIIDIESVPPVQSQALNPRRRRVVPSPDRLVLRKV